MSQKQDPERNMGAWKCVGEVAFPTNLETVDDVMALVRLVTKASADTWLSMYFYGPPQAGVQRTVSLGHTLGGLRADQSEGVAKASVSSLGRISALDQLGGSIRRFALSGLSRRRRVVQSQERGRGIQKTACPGASLAPRQPLPFSPPTIRLGTSPCSGQRQSP